MLWRILFASAVALGTYSWFQDRPVAQPSGMLVAQAPMQTHLAAVVPHFALNGYSIEVLERFSLAARVLGVAHYRSDREAELSPVDLALGWGPMSDSDVLRHVQITQGNRFYYWRVQHFPIPRKEIETHSANMHLIPATDQVGTALSAVRLGQVVHIEGYLVEARAKDGWHWRSSLTREDTGAGACEVVWVEKLSSM
jgi:hypothetical protein